MEEPESSITTYSFKCLISSSTKMGEEFRKSPMAFNKYGRQQCA